MHRLALLLLVLLTACSTKKREYQPPASDMVSKTTSSRAQGSRDQPPSAASMLPEYGEVVGLGYSNNGGEDSVLDVVSGVASFNPVPLLGLLAGPGDSHIPTYRIRVKGTRHELYVRDPDCPPMARGTQVIVTPKKKGGYTVRPCRP